MEGEGGQQKKCNGRTLMFLNGYFGDFEPQRKKRKNVSRSGKIMRILRSIRKKKLSFWPYYVFFFNQVCSFKMLGYWPRSLLRFY